MKAPVTTHGLIIEGLQEGAMQLSWQNVTDIMAMSSGLGDELTSRPKGDVRFSFLKYLWLEGIPTACASPGDSPT